MRSFPSGIIFTNYIFRMRLMYANMVRWLYAVKNVRCVVLLDDDNSDHSRVISWIAKKHRYRRVGISPETAFRYESERLKKEPFMVLDYPHGALETLVKEIAPADALHVIETLALALAHSAPVVSPSTKLEEKISRHITAIRRVKNYPPENEILRHLRISGYVPIDFFEEAERASKLALTGDAKKTELLAAKRSEAAKKDLEKRFWRISPEEGPLPIVAYYDLFNAVSDSQLVKNAGIGGNVLSLILPIGAIFFITEKAIAKSDKK